MFKNPRECGKISDAMTNEKAKKILDALARSIGYKCVEAIGHQYGPRFYYDLEFWPSNGDWPNPVRILCYEGHRTIVVFGKLGNEDDVYVDFLAKMLEKSAAGCKVTAEMVIDFEDVPVVVRANSSLETVLVELDLKGISYE